MSNLMHDIVIVNEFSVNGSRGKTPGNYILEYCLRDEATENMAPTFVKSSKVQQINEQFQNMIHTPEIDMEPKYKKRKKSDAKSNSESEEVDISNDYVRYMARETATNVLLLKGVDNVEKLKSEFKGIQKLSGRGFNDKSISLSNDEIRAIASDADDAMADKNKTILKTVVSFDTDYLIRMGVLPAGTEVKKKGDLYGKADQAKLRMAIQHGMRNIKSDFSDLKWIGAIQSDTEHIHCHLLAWDDGPGKRFARNGEQKGKLSMQMMHKIRVGIDNSLDHNGKIKPLSIQMSCEKQNTLSYIKRFTSKIIEERGLPQYLMACLPKDNKNLWRASFNADGGIDNTMILKGKKYHGNMKKANEIVRGYVIDLLNRPDSGFIEAKKARHEYFEACKERGDYNNETIDYPYINSKGKQSVRKKRITPDEKVRELDKKYEEEVIINGMNAVYGILKNVDEKTINTQTSFIDAMAMPYEEMIYYVKDDKMMEFGFKLRSYASRLEYHKTNYKNVNQILHDYEDGDQSTYDPASKAVYDFLKIEQQYNHALMCKYQKFLDFYHTDENYKDEFDELYYVRQKALGREAMKNDPAFQTKFTDPRDARQYGLDQYGLDSGDLLFNNPGAFEEIKKKDDREYYQSLRNFKEHLAENGFLYNEKEHKIERGLQYDFEDVKAYDLHHLTYDFTYDFPIAMVNVNNFIEISDKRFAALKKAEKYLESTHQEGMLNACDPADVYMAKKMADTYRGSNNVYHTKYDDKELKKYDTKTIRMDDEIYRQLSGPNMIRRLHDIMYETDVQTEVETTDETTVSRPSGPES